MKTLIINGSPKKNGVLILVGAEKGTEVIPEKTALSIMKHMYVHLPCAATVYSLDTNNVPAREDSAALENAHKAALLLNDLCYNGNSEYPIAEM